MCPFPPKAWLTLCMLSYNPQWYKRRRKRKPKAAKERATSGLSGKLRFTQTQRDILKALRTLLDGARRRARILQTTKRWFTQNADAFQFDADKPGFPHIGRLLFLMGHGDRDVLRFWKGVLESPSTTWLQPLMFPNMDELFWEPQKLAKELRESIKACERLWEHKGSSEPPEDKEAPICCTCAFNLETGHMVQCDRCDTWQHTKCTGYTRQQIEDPEFRYLCDVCDPNTHNQRLFTIEQILKRDALKDKVLIKWKGYGAHFNSWIPVSQVPSECQAMLPPEPPVPLPGPIASPITSPIACARPVQLTPGEPVAARVLRHPCLLRAPRRV